MKSVADLIANKNALIKRDQRGKITAASLTAAGAAVPVSPSAAVALPARAALTGVGAAGAAGRLACCS